MQETKMVESLEACLVWISLMKGEGTKNLLAVCLRGVEEGDNNRIRDGEGVGKDDCKKHSPWMLHVLRIGPPIIPPMSCFLLNKCLCHIVLLLSCLLMHY